VVECLPNMPKSIGSTLAPQKKKTSNFESINRSSYSLGQSPHNLIIWKCPHDISRGMLYESPRHLSVQSSWESRFISYFWLPEMESMLVWHPFHSCHGMGSVCEYVYVPPPSLASISVILWASHQWVFPLLNTFSPPHTHCQPAFCVCPKFPSQQLSPHLNLHLDFSFLFW
jgi:hypothetical protein